MENKRIGVVFSSESTKVAEKDKGIIYNDVSYVCVDKNTNDIIAIGKEAKQMKGRVSDPLSIVKPVSHGDIADADLFEKMVNIIFGEILDEVKDADLVVALRINANDANKDFLTRVLSKFNPKSINFVPNIVLAAIGDGVDIDDSYGSIILDIGFSKATVGIIANGEVISHKTTSIAEDYLDNQITIFFKEKYSLVISSEEVDKVKYSLGSVVKLNDELELILYGKDLLTNEKRKVIITDSDVKKLFVAQFSNYRSMITGALENAPAYIRTGILKNGIFISGNLSKVHGVANYFKDFFEVPTTISKYGGTTVLEGTVLYKIKD